MKTEDYIWVDVRTPTEYRQGHVPGAFNLPLFTDEERSEVGTIYARSGKNAAIERGLELTGPRLARMLRQGKALSQKGKLMLYCWRGGMRSTSVAWLLRLEGINVEVYPGGYKSYRNTLTELLSLPWKFIVLGGPTLCGKTEILKEMARRGEQMIDLEGLAHHKGSAFGGIGQGEQPNNEEFSNLLHFQLEQFDPGRTVWCEGESLNMGKVVMPKYFYDRLTEAPMIWVERSRDVRRERAISEYGRMPSHLLIECFEKIRKRIGFDSAQKGIESIRSGNLGIAADIAIDYYDKTYLYSLQKRTGRILHRCTGNKSCEEMTDEILAAVKTH